MVVSMRRCLAVLCLLASSTAHAQYAPNGYVYSAPSYQQVPPVYVAPVYVAPVVVHQPVVVARPHIVVTPQPVYVAPRPIVVTPAPVVVQRPVVPAIAITEPAYRTGAVVRQDTHYVTPAGAFEERVTLNARSGDYSVNTFDNRGRPLTRTRVDQTPRGRVVREWVR